MAFEHCQMLAKGGLGLGLCSSMVVLSAQAGFYLVFDIAIFFCRMSSMLLSQVLPSGSLIVSGWLGGGMH